MFGATPVTITVQGTPVTGVVNLSQGWNLIGPSVQAPVPVNAKLQGNAWWWDTGSGFYRAAEKTGTLDVGKGYWFWAKEAFTLDFGR